MVARSNPFAVSHFIPGSFSKLAGVLVILSIERIQRPQVRFIFVKDHRRVPDVLHH